MKKTMLLTGLGALLLAGCASSNKVQDISQCHYPDSPSSKAPTWVCDVKPEDLAISATGYAKKNAAGHSIMRTIASNDARANLAQAFEIDVNDSFKQLIKSTDATDTTQGEYQSAVQTFERMTKTMVSRNLTNSRVYVTQTSPTGGLYVLVGMDENTYQQNKNKILKESLASDSALWKTFNNQQAEKELQSALSDLMAD